MPARKRGREEMEASEPPASEQPGLLTQLRNDWRFANLMQFIYLFGKAFKIDEDFDIEDLEEECLTPGRTEKLAAIGLCLLKHVSSHRGLTPDLFDEYTRRQWVARQPHDNPFGEAEQPNKFADFSIFTKLRVLTTMTQWTLSNPERFREKMSETKESEQTNWRIEEYGWDREDRVYFLLDDNRLYRRTLKPAPPPPPPKTKSKSKTRPRPKGSRSSKRRKTADSEELDDFEEDGVLNGVDTQEEAQDDGFGGDKWECLCVTLQDYQSFLDTVRRSKDENENSLYKRLSRDVLPIIESSEDERAKKLAKRQRELMTLEKLATAKRSSRIANKAEKEKEEQAVREAEEKRLTDLATAHKEAGRQKEMEAARMSRMMTREQRLKEREYKRILHEEELKQMAEEHEKIENGEIEAKKSERQLKAEIKKKQEALDELKDDEEEDWTFDCSGCGVHGKNIDDGKHSVACERCNVWEHSACLGLKQEEAESDDFHFICKHCKRKEEDAKRPKIPMLKFRVGASSSPPQQKPSNVSQGTNDPALHQIQTTADKPIKQQKRKVEGQGSVTNGFPPMKKFMPVKQQQDFQTQAQPTPQTSRPSMHSMHSSFMNGPTLSPQGQVQSPVNGTRPPGLVSPQRPSFSPSQSMQFGPPLHKPNGVTQSFSNGHSPQKQSPPPQRQHSQPQTPAQPDPFRNSFSSQPSTSVQNRASPYQNPPSFPPPMLPPQATPTSSFTGTVTSSQRIPPSTPSQHSAVPQKQPSAAPSPTPSAVLQASSPPMAYPTRPDAAIAGISPVKNSPPRPTSRDVGIPPVIPPAQKLVPSPKAEAAVQVGARSPVKPSLSPAGPTKSE